MANCRAVDKVQVSLWLTRNQREQLKKIAAELGFQSVTELFAYIATGEVGIDLRPKRARARLQRTDAQVDMLP